jgi:GNAT superfamily N-acetyltransferase
LALFSTEDGWSMSEDQWSDYYDRLLPSGLFLAFHAPSRTVIGTAGAVHNPRGGRYYFPFGGELANLLVHPAHRSHGLGRALCLHIVQRFLTAGYTSIRLGVQGWRLPAVKTYFTTGFVPFLYQPDLAERWERVCHTIDWPYTPHKWPTAL